MSDDPETDTLIHDAASRDDTLPPLRPTKEYEEITLREVSLGFASGVQDLTLYPEDTMEADELGNIRIQFLTMGGGEFVAYAGHTEWHSIREHRHTREKGTLRPSPEKMMRELREQQNRDRVESIRQKAERDAADSE